MKIMKTRLSFLSRILAGVFCLCMVVPAEATLMSRLGGAAAYDDVLDITWVTDADLSGSGNWAGQVAWADSLDYLGFDDWRLASMSVARGLPTGTAASVVSGHTSCTPEPACRDNELGYMFYHNLGGIFGNDLTGNQTVDGVDLMNIQSHYWSGTEFNSSLAWLFNFPGGSQDSSDKLRSFHGWAVRSGDVSAVPAPGTVLLLGIGLAGLGFARRRRLNA